MDRYDVEKVAHAIKFFLEKDVERLGKTKLMKLLFFADKEHLKKYRRPIFFDTYFKLPHGPVPTLTLNIIDSINENENTDLKEWTEIFKEHIIVEEKLIEGDKFFTVFKPKKEFDADFFSKSEIEILERIADKFKKITAVDISNLSHELPEYRHTEMGHPIDYAKMAPEQKDYIEFIEQTNKEFEKLFE